MDRETSELVFRSVKRRDRQDRGEEPVAKRLKVDAQRESCPVVMLTGISQSIAKKLKAVSDLPPQPDLQTLAMQSYITAPIADYPATWWQGH